MGDGVENSKLRTSSRMKGIALGVIGVVAVVSTFLVYSNVKQARREAAYRNAIAPYQRDLRVGATRAEVEKYLDAHTVAYNPVYWGSSPSDAWGFAIKVGEEPGDHIACDRWLVYIALDFKSATNVRSDEPSPSDVLKGISIKRIGHCL